MSSGTIHKVRRLLELASNPSARDLRRANVKVLKELARLRNLPRYTHTKTWLLGGEFEIIDPASFLFQYDEIIKRQIYDFGHGSPRLIIDGGANIGLAATYFARRYPGARILAFEPDPAIFPVLKRNVEAAGAKNVELFQFALSSMDGEIRFMPDGSDGGRMVAEHELGAVQLPARRLFDFLDEKVDLLKLDIEGAEGPVIADCEPRLCNVDRLFVEYHSFYARPQEIDQLLAVLRRANFRVYVESITHCERPFVRKQLPADGAMDLQLNIFAGRSGSDEG